MTPLKGNTFLFKDEIKSLGGRWDKDNKVWMIPSQYAEDMQARINAGAAADRPASSERPKAQVFSISKKSSAGAPVDAEAFPFFEEPREMSAVMMGALIRRHKHHITLDKKSDANVCILHGKRADNGDHMSASFSMDDAKRAGLLSKEAWKLYPEDMLFARALSRLARRLFQDIIGNCYVEGEISDAPIKLSETDKLEYSIDEDMDNAEPPASPTLFEKITMEEAEELDNLIGEDDAWRAQIMNYIANQFGGSHLEDIPISMYDKIYARCKERFNQRTAWLHQQEAQV